MSSLTPQQIDRLLESWQEPTGQSGSAAERLLLALQRAVAAEGLTLDASDTVAALRSYRLPSSGLSRDQVRLLLTVLLGDQQLRGREAFRVLAGAGDAVDLESLERLLNLFEIPSDTVRAIVLEVDQDGAESISLNKFLAYLPSDFDPHPRAYRASHFGTGFTAVRVSPPGTVVQAAAATAAVGSALPRAPISGSDPEGAPLPDAPRLDPLALGEQRLGTSPLQMQIGLFRLLQGAAYRSFRESYSANSETHLRAYDLPYTIPDFCRFVNAALDYYLSLGIVEPGAEAPFEDLRASVNRAEAELRDRMARWSEIPHTEAMLEAEALLERELAELDHHHQLFAAMVELLLSAGLLGHSPETLSLEDLHHLELNRLRLLEDHHELSRSTDQQADVGDGEDARDRTRRPFLETWQRVIVDPTDSRFAGSIMPTAYWYEEFMPLLLRACSVLTLQDLQAWESTTEAELDDWFARTDSEGEFDRYGLAVKNGFRDCSLTVKREIRRAWELTRHYLNGVQKRRERQEFGRESGFLCQYVAFLDVYLGRHDVEESEMRLSFPYYIGPATWRFLHTSAELVASQSHEQQQASVGLFKAFFAAFATMYPCPYCRFHLNRYVVKNREVTMYPIEYLLLGSSEVASTLEVTVQDKLAVIEDAESLRLFLWKLHNTVSSSIARSEEWFHKDDTAYYTTRYWPGLDSELERAHTLEIDLIRRDRVQRIYGVVKSAVHLSILRDELQLALHQEDLEQQRQIRRRASTAIASVEQAVLDSRFLHDHYTYNPELALEPPHFSPAEEALARSGFFTED
ncbi:MAG: ERV1/ALR-related protein [Cyanobacteriota bacterium]